jgi:hypothetical protein
MRPDHDGLFRSVAGAAQSIVDFDRMTFWKDDIVAVIDAKKRLKLARSKVSSE